MPDVSAGGRTFAQIISGNVDIPDYQREFSWEVSTATGLIKDLFGHIKSYSQSTATPNTFFLGNLITVGNNPTNLVDGQQRFTALTVMAVLIRDICWERGWHEKAFEIDESLIYDQNTGKQTEGRYRMKPRSNPAGIAGIDATCPLKNMDYLCSIDFEEVDFAEVTNVVHPGNAVTIYLNKVGAPGNSPPPPKWNIREGLVIEFSGGAKLTVSHPIAQGGNVTQLQGDLDAIVNLGETMTLRYGKKNGKKPHLSRQLAKVVEEYESEINNFLNTPPPTPVPPQPQLGSHLLDQQQRLDQLCKGLSSTYFTYSQFQQAGDGLQYFGKINDGARREDLSTLDLLRALIFEVRDGAPKIAGQAYNATENEILTQWEIMEEKLLLKQNKNEGVAKDFFYYLLICDGHYREGNTRHTKGSEYPVLKKVFFPYEEYVGWKKTAVLENLRYINEMSVIYLDAIRFPWTHCPPYREHEEFYLRALQKCSFKQHIPLYMAARKKFDTINSSNTKKKSMVSLLRMMNYLNLRSTIIPGLLDNLESLSSGDFYGQNRGWITVIDGLPDNADWSVTGGNLDCVKNVLNDILGTETAGLVPGTGIKGMVENFEFEDTMPTLSSTPLTAHTNLLNMKSEQAPKIHYILGLLEFKYQTGGRLTQVFQTQTNVEHILPATYEAAEWGVTVPGGGFTVAQHEEHLERLANKVLLEYSINDHFHNKSYHFKLNYHNICGRACGNHLTNSVFEQVRNNPKGLIHKHPDTWSLIHLESRARQLADDLVNVMDPRKLIGPLNKNL
jgi:hypothetical protein